MTGREISPITDDCNCSSFHCCKFFLSVFFPLRTFLKKTHTYIEKRCRDISDDPNNININSEEICRSDSLFMKEAQPVQIAAVPLKHIYNKFSGWNVENPHWFTTWLPSHVGNRNIYHLCTMDFHFYNFTYVVWN